MIIAKQKQAFLQELADLLTKHRASICSKNNGDYSEVLYQIADDNGQYLVGDGSSQNTAYDITNLSNKLLKQLSKAGSNPEPSKGRLYYKNINSDIVYCYHPCGRLYYFDDNNWHLLKEKGSNYLGSLISSKSVIPLVITIHSVNLEDPPIPQGATHMRINTTDNSLRYYKMEGRYIFSWDDNQRFWLQGLPMYPANYLDDHKLFKKLRQ